VSQALRRLEERLGVALVQRTTRSVHLTEAGARLYAAARPALNDLEAAVAAVGEMGVESAASTHRLAPPPRHNAVAAAPHPRGANQAARTSVTR
jgi:DNA-binding transcriptional LysR family regulator